MKSAINLPCINRTKVCPPCIMAVLFVIWNNRKSERHLAKLHVSFNFNCYKLYNYTYVSNTLYYLEIWKSGNCIKKQIDGWKEGWVDGWMSKQMDKCTDWGMNEWLN